LVQIEGFVYSKNQENNIKTRPVESTFFEIHVSRDERDIIEKTVIRFC